MHFLVYGPFAVSILGAAVSRVAALRLWPRAAARAIAVTAVVLAGCVAGAVALLACPLPAQIPVVAAVGRWRPHAVGLSTPVPAWVSAVALVLVAGLAWRVLREARALAREYAAVAAVQAELSRCGRAQVVVVDDTVPRAHALAPTMSRRGRIVVSSALLDLLDDEERAAVVAHERAHLRHRHVAYVAAVRLAAALNPLLLPMRGDMEYALERWADEDAAAVTDRAVVAGALAKTALGVLDRLDRLARPPRLALLHLHGQGHRVTERIAALLDEPARRRPRLAWALLALATIATASLLWATHDTEQVFEAARRWSHHH